VLLSVCFQLSKEVARLVCWVGRILALGTWVSFAAAVKRIGVL